MIANENKLVTYNNNMENNSNILKTFLKLVMTLLYTENCVDLLNKEITEFVVQGSLVRFRYFPLTFDIGHSEFICLYPLIQKSSRVDYRSL